MIFEVNGIKLDIPDDLIKERKEIFFFDTEEETIADIEKDISRYLECCSKRKLESPKLNKRVVEWFLNDHEFMRDWFDPNQKITVTFNVLAGFFEEIEVDGMLIYIPTSLFRDRYEYLDLDRDENIEDIKRMHSIYLEQYLRENNNCLEGYEESFIAYLESELEKYK